MFMSQLRAMAQPEFSYAYVRFRDDNVQAIVRTSDIVKFDETTHHESKMYLVRWLPDIEGGTERMDLDIDEEPETYRAQILLLAKTKEEIETKLAGGSRMRIPKILDSTVEDTDDDIGDGHNPNSLDHQLSNVNNSSSAMSVARKKKKRQDATQKKTVQAAQFSTLKRIMQQKLKAKVTQSTPSIPASSAKGPAVHKPLMPKPSQPVSAMAASPPHPAPCHSTPDHPHVQAGSSKRPDGVHNSTSNELQQLKKENASLRQQLEEERNLNRKLQTRILEKFDGLEEKIVRLSATPSAPTPASTSSDKAQEDEEGSKQLYIPVDGQVYLGHDISLPSAQFDMVSSQTKHSLFVKNLAVCIWGSDNLRQRSVTGKSSNRFKDRAVGEPLEAAKLQAICDCFLHRLTQLKTPDEEKQKELGKVNAYISEKIMDLRRNVKAT